MASGPGVSSFTTRTGSARPVVVGGNQRVTTSTGPAAVTIGAAQRVLRVDRSGSDKGSSKGGAR